MGSEKGIGQQQQPFIGQQYSKEMGADLGGEKGTRAWETTPQQQQQEFDKGYQQESDLGQKSHAWKEKLHGKESEQREYGENPYEPLVERGKRVAFEEQPSGRHKGDWGSGQQQQQQQQTSHADWGVTGKQEREQTDEARAKNVEVCKGKEPCPKSQTPCPKSQTPCPKEKEKEPCPGKEPCSTHAKQTKETEWTNKESLAKQTGGKEMDLSKKEGTGAALPTAIGQKQEGESEQRDKEEEGKGEEQERRRMDPKLKEEIQQCKDARFNNIMTVMQKTKCKALLDSHKPLVTVSDSTSLNEALVTLNENDLSSCPVLNHEGEFMGFIDMLGVTRFTMCLYDKLNKQGGSQIEGRPQQKPQQSISRMEEWKSETVGGLINKGLIPRDHFSVHGSSNLYEAFELMARTRQHRIALTGKRNEVIGVLTQSMMMEFLYDHKKDLYAVGDIAVLRVRPYTFLATVKEDEPAFHAFDIMAKQNLSGVAVVNQKGEIVDGISVRDLRGVCSGAGCDFSPLQKSVMQFKKVVVKAKKEFKWTGQLLVKNEDNFETVLEKLVKLRAHRLFVIDREQKPVDVITGSSIMMMMLHCAFPQDHWGPLT